MGKISKEVQNVLFKLQQANRVMEDLIDLAMADREISEDEKEILFSINSNLQEYVKLTIASVSDNKITDEELATLKQIEGSIIQDANSVALKDAQISDDEKKLLDSLIAAIKDLSTN